MNRPEDIGRESAHIDPELAELWESADATVRAPQGFEERLFARLAREAPARIAAPALPAREAMPWWVRAAGEWHVALALVIAGLFAGWPALWLDLASPARDGAASVVRLAESYFVPLLAPVVAPFAAPRVALALAIGLAPVIVWASYGLARAIERRALRMALGRRA